MRYNKKHWSKIYFKVGTMPGDHYFVATSDLPNMVIGGHLTIRRDDGSTNPAYQHGESVLIDEIRSIGPRQILYVVERM